MEIGIQHNILNKEKYILNNCYNAENKSMKI
jgi:hypothetical protein